MVKNFYRSYLRAGEKRNPVPLTKTLIGKSQLAVWSITMVVGRIILIRREIGYHAVIAPAR